jgi:hypothetical protein
MALGDTRKEPCEFCGGPAGECTEIRGGFLPETVCKKRPTYQELWEELERLNVIDVWEKGKGNTLSERLGNVIQTLEEDNDELRDFIDWLLGDCDQTEAWQQYKEEMDNES